MLSKANALYNTFEALRLNRVIHQGHPPSIRVHCGAAGVIECRSGWSKSATHNNTRQVFLILSQSDDVDAKLPHAQSIEWGETVFPVTERVPPEEAGSYWLLAIKEA